MFKHVSDDPTMSTTQWWLSGFTFQSAALLCSKCVPQCLEGKRKSVVVLLSSKYEVYMVEIKHYDDDDNHDNKKPSSHPWSAAFIWTVIFPVSQLSVSCVILWTRLVFPLSATLISVGHTEAVHMHVWASHIGGGCSKKSLLLSTYTKERVFMTRQKMSCLMALNKGAEGKGF